MQGGPKTAYTGWLWQASVWHAGDPAVVHHRDMVTQWWGLMLDASISEEVKHRALTQVAARLVVKKRPWLAVAGPTGAMLMTADRLGWAVHSGGEFTTDRGLKLQVGRHSAAFAAALITESTEAWTDCLRYGKAPTVLSSGSGLNWRAYRTAAGNAVRTLKIPRDEGLRQAAIRAAGGVWTQERLYRRGGATHGSCLACHGRGSLLHRVFECPALTLQRDRWLSPGTRKWLATRSNDECVLLAQGLLPRHLMDSPTPGSTEVMPVHCEEFATDGSAVWPREPARRRASWAVCPLRGFGLQSGLVRANEDPWQTVYGGELLGLRAALQAKLVGPVTVYVDNAAVVALANRGPGTRGEHKYAHLWRDCEELGLDTRARVQKIKAHASDTTQAGVANGRADAEAKECLRRPGPCRAREVEQQVVATAYAEMHCWLAVLSGLEKTGLGDMEPMPVRGDWGRAVVPEKSLGPTWQAQEW
eukprot:6475126-Amphidinium_carterae.1